MYDRSSGRTDRFDVTEQSSATDHPAASPSDKTPRLVAETVDGADQPDRRTIYPPGLSGIERMERWLTANAHAFVDLDAWR